MKRFILQILVWIGIPICLLIGLYVALDPYRIVFPYSISYFIEKPLSKTTNFVGFFVQNVYGNE